VKVTGRWGKKPSEKGGEGQLGEENAGGKGRRWGKKKKGEGVEKKGAPMKKTRGGTDHNKKEKGFKGKGREPHR